MAITLTKEFEERLKQTAKKAGDLSTDTVLRRALKLYEFTLESGAARVEMKDDNDVTTLKVDLK